MIPRFESISLYKELFGVTDDSIFISHYRQPHRYYHNMEHLEYVTSLMHTAEEKIAALFHDIVYDPRKNDNEDRSIGLFVKHANDCEAAVRIIKLIETTKEGGPGSLLRTIDRSYLGISDTDQIRKIELNMFKEFQFVPVKQYVHKRREFLSKNATADYHDRAIMCHHYNIGVYAGSFDPIHIGHQSVIEQAEQVFDKVIIAVGKNPDKAPGKVFSDVETSFPYHQVIHYDGLLTDMLQNISNPYCNLTLIRGLRNGYDLSYEMNQLKFMRDMFPQIKVVFIPCDRDREHISSTAIRSLIKIGKEKEADAYMVKKYRYDP